MDFKDLSDEEIVLKYKSGSDDAMTFMLEKYKTLVREIARSYFLIDGDKDDLIQEGMIGLYKAVRNYNDSRECSFKTFANLCIERQIFSAINSSKSKKNMLLNKSISYDVLIEDEKTGNETNYVEMLRGTNVYDPETSYLDKETADALYKNIKKNLSRFESEVFDAFVDGMTYIQIADKLGKTPKSIDNAIQRIKIKSEKAKLDME